MAVQYEGWSIVAQYRKCGKHGCKTCVEGPGHGPYYYGTKMVDGRRRSKYFGRQPPPPSNIQENTQEAALQSENHGLKAKNAELMEQVASLKKQLAAVKTSRTEIETKGNAIQPPNSIYEVNTRETKSSPTPAQMESGGELSLARVEDIWAQEIEKMDYSDAIVQQAYRSFVNGVETEF